jgi:addiction module HigA family antidote
MDNIASASTISGEYVLRRINEIVHEKRSILADTALRLGRYFGISPQFWLNLQTRLDLEVAEDLLAERLENNDVHGKIIRLNQKTATIKTNTNTEWRVGYKWLYAVINLEQGIPHLIEDRMIDEKKIIQ